MNRLTLYIFTLVWLSTAAALPARAQRARVAGLEQNAEYMRLLGEQLRLKAREDSTVRLINDGRKAFENNTVTDKQKLGGDIVRMEGELFDIRSRVGKITAQVAAIEQDYIINHMGSQTGTASAAAGNAPNSGGKRTLFANPFFTDNLTRTDAVLFGLTPRVEPEIFKINKRIHDLYGQLTTVKRQYDEAKSQEVIDSLALRAGEVKEQIEQVDALMERLWLAIYNRKLDNYLVLMDRIGTIDRLKLEQLDQESRQVRRAEGLAGEQLAPLVATYPLQKRLVLDYELAMAQALGLKLAEDSLATELKRLPAEKMAETMTYPDIPFAPRSLVVYGPITKDGALNYTSVADVPTLHIPKTGLYYTVQIGIYTTAPANVSGFKGMAPVMSQKMPTGQTRYVAGGFAKYGDALAAVNQMIRAGLRASMVAFSDGKPVTAVKAKALEAAVSAPPAGAVEKPQSGSTAVKRGGYSVEITPAELRLPTAMRETITAKAPGKSIVRSTAGTAVIYSVGNFATKAEADALAEELNSQPNVKIKVVGL